MWAKAACCLTCRTRTSGNFSRQAFLGFEAGQRCFPDPVVSNNEGTERIPYVPSGREIVGECINDKGKKVDGLTYEGELNKVGTYVLLGFVGARRLCTQQ